MFNFFSVSQRKQIKILLDFWDIRFGKKEEYFIQNRIIEQIFQQLQKEEKNASLKKMPLFDIESYRKSI